MIPVNISLKLVTFVRYKNTKIQFGIMSKEQKIVVGISLGDIARLMCETKRGKDQKMKWIAKCVEKGQISRANKCLMSERSDVQNAEEVVESIKNLIKSTRKAGCEDDERAISNSELKKDKNISVQTSFMPKITDLHQTIMSLKC